MKVGFWNINNNTGTDICDAVTQFAHSDNIDFLILIESNLDPSVLLNSLNSNGRSYHFLPPTTMSKFAMIFTTFSTSFLISRHDSLRITAKEYLSPIGENVNFIILHYPSKLHFDSADQNSYISDTKEFIDYVESKTNNDRSIIIGDFNMNPFQDAMIQSHGLHSTFDRNIALRQDRIVKEKTHKFLYNPMWSFFGEFGKGLVNGTYYKSMSKPINLFWNIFDQVLLRPSLITSVFDESTLQIVTQFGNINLLSRNSIIKGKLSDHLPIEFELNNI